MTIELLPETTAIRDAFSRAVADAGGTVTDAYIDGHRLFLRSTFPDAREVKPGDWTNHGVALRTRDDEILVHPYLFRQVCRNGSILARAVETRRIERFEFASRPGQEESALVEVREAVRECSGEHVLAEATDRLREMVDREADLALSYLPAITRMPPDQAPHWFDAIQRRFARGADRTMYGLMNVITALARDVADPDARWRLEEMGGGMLAVLSPAPTPDDACGVLALA
jgi:hypothetical protein